LIQSIAFLPLFLPLTNTTPNTDKSSGPANAEEKAERLAELRAELLELLDQTGSDPASDDDDQFTIGPKGLWARSADGQSSMKVGGRIQADSNNHSGESTQDGVIQDGTELRRARFELKGTLPQDLKWAAEVDFANNATSIKDFWVGHAADGDPEITFGHQKQPYSLDVEMSSNDIPFVERGIDTFLIIPFVDRAIGARIQDNNDSLFYAAGVFGEGITPNAVDDEGWGAVGRVVYAPVRNDNEVVHLAARGAFRQPEDGSQSVRIRDETTNMSNFRVVDTGVLTGVDSVQAHGYEAAWAKGPFSIGGEYNMLTVDQTAGDLDFESWHAQATYTLTGETRAKAYRLNAGEFKRLRAENPGDKPWEVAARVASIDLNSGAVSGGEQQAFSFGLNCYYSENLRLMWNYTNIYDTSGGSMATSDAEGMELFTFRVQLNF